MTIACPLLTIMADIIGCFGGALITVFEVDVTFRFVFEQMTETVGIADLMHGIGKSVFFGFFKRNSNNTAPFLSVPWVSLDGFRVPLL